MVRRCTLAGEGRYAGSRRSRPRILCGVGQRLLGMATIGAGHRRRRHQASIVACEREDNGDTRARAFWICGDGRALGSQRVVKSDSRCPRESRNTQTSVSIMVRPRYIICSEGQVVDRATNLVTYYNVIDSITIDVPVPEPDTPVLVGFSTHVSAVWMREDDSEKDAEFEAEVRMSLPGSDELHVIRHGNFRFGEYYFHRIDVAIRPGPPVAGAIAIKPCDGVMRLECRIRPAQGGDWVSQDYLIPFKVNRIGSPADAEGDSSSA